jgi:GDPmannose 4,6-dehydratase
VVQKTALIFGISGQDGSYLAELLLEKGYRVCGTVRRHSVAENQDSRIVHLDGLIEETAYCDLTSESSVVEAIRRFQPDEIYNLAAQSHVRVSFDVPQYTFAVNALGVLNLLIAAKELNPGVKIYQASSSEMFGLGIDADGSQRETTSMIPTSPYGCAKLAAYSLVRHYRRAYRMFYANGILFNHESPRRGENFVTQKIIRRAVEIDRGLASELVLGNIDSQRDWGHSKDYVRAMHLIMQYETPDDWVVSTGETRSVRDLCEFVFSRFDRDYRDYVRQDQRYMRSEELPYLRGDSTKVRTVLGWKPEYTFEAMIDEMIEHWERKIVDGQNLLRSRAG